MSGPSGTPEHSHTPHARICIKIQQRTDRQIHLKKKEHAEIHSMHLPVHNAVLKW